MSFTRFSHEDVKNRGSPLFFVFVCVSWSLFFSYKRDCGHEVPPLPRAVRLRLKRAGVRGGRGSRGSRGSRRRGGVASRQRSGGMKHRRVLTRDGNRMNRHIRRQHDTSACSRRHGRLPFHTRLTCTLFGIRGADDLILLVDGAGDFHGRGHGFLGGAFGYLFLRRF